MALHTQHHASCSAALCVMCAASKFRRNVRQAGMNLSIQGILSSTARSKGTPIRRLCAPALDDQSSPHPPSQDSSRPLTNSAFTSILVQFPSSPRCRYCLQNARWPGRWTCAAPSRSGRLPSRMRPASDGAAAARAVAAAMTRRFWRPWSTPVSGCGCRRRRAGARRCTPSLWTSPCPKGAFRP